VLSRNYLREVNAASLAVPAEQRAWPIYRQGYLAMPSMRDEPWIKLDKWPNYTPDDPMWPTFVQYVRAAQPALVSVRRGAAMERSAYLVNAEVTKTPANPSDPSGVQDPGDINPPTIGILLPQLQAYRSMARLLKADVLVAVEARDGSTVAADLLALPGLARHAGEDRTLIAQLVGLAIIELTDDVVGHVLRDHPELLTDEQWKDLAHRLAAYRPTPDGPAEQVSLVVERYMTEDLLQRFFTDDGHGDGHFIQNDTIYAYWGLRKPGGMSAMAPIASAVLAGRADTLRVYNELMDMEAATFAQPRYARDAGAVDRRWGEIRSSAAGMRYSFIMALFPALGKAQGSADTSLERRDGTVVAIALELFKRKNGRYPSTLAELAPGYLPAVPMDKWSGAPLGYRAGGSEVTGGRPLIYSVGANKIDDGGVMNTPWYPDAAAGRAMWPAAGGDIATKDWVLWPPVETVGEIPQPPTGSVRHENSATEDMSQIFNGLMPWNQLWSVGAK
jgi:hypothetical protein